MNSISLIIKGFFIGVGKIMPGVSGSLLAITMGIYDRIMDSIGNFFKNIKENIKFLFPLLIGIGLAIILTSKLLYRLLDSNYFLTMSLFIGLIIGGVPSVVKKVKYFNFKNILIFVISFMFVFSLSFLPNNDTFGINKYPVYIFFLIGLLDAATMIIPGISGSAIMILLGCYGTVLNLFGNIYDLANFKNIVFFLTGVLVGVYFISKLISHFLKKYYHESFSCILGFLTSSIFILMINILKCGGNILIGTLLFIIGVVLSLCLEK